MNEGFTDICPQCRQKGVLFRYYVKQMDADYFMCHDCLKNLNLIIEDTKTAMKRILKGGPIL